MKKLNSILIDLEKCTGCQACEMACSFHFAKVFSHTLSAIHVQRDNKNGEIIAVISSKCDLCSDLPNPLCIQFCAPKAIRVVSNKI